MLRWNQAQLRPDQDMQMGFSFRTESLCLIDQFFLFLCRVKEGAFEESLAGRFNVSQATVSRVLLTWTNYLFFMFGSLNVWFF